VENPDKYAEVLLGISQPEEHYTSDRIQAMYGKSERTINFKRPIPVYITYQTAFVDDAGLLHARADLYGHDKTITSILHGERRVADIAIPRSYSNSGGGRPTAASSRTSRRAAGGNSFRVARRFDTESWGYSSRRRASWSYRQSPQTFFQPRFFFW
jgi:hypothetical protein